MTVKTLIEFVVFSDIHGNSEALSLFLQKEFPIRGRKFIFLGDIAGYYYDTSRCLTLLKKIPGLVAVRGNHDEMYLQKQSNPKLEEQLCQKYSSSYKDGDSEVLQYIAALPLQREILCGDTKLLIQHGSPDNPLEGRIYPDTVLPPYTDGKKRIILTGHTHYQMLRKEGNAVWLNPGSLGQPRDGKGFSYAVLSLEEKTGDMEVDFRTVSPDLASLEQEIKERDPDHPYLIEVLHRTRA